jgi:hypothetical protein
MIKKLRNQPYAPKVEQAPKCGSKRKKKKKKQKEMKIEQVQK